MLKLVLFLGLAYVLMDLCTAAIYGRCVVPWLRCRACRRSRG